MPNWESIDLEKLKKIAFTAGEEILKVYNSDDFEVALKSDRSPLTLADRKSHQSIAEGLKAEFPEYPIISEEGNIPSFEERKSWNSFWLVDPLDGTKEFIKRNGEFTINIALVVDDEPVVGLIFAPALKLLYYGKKGVGAFKQVEGGDAQRIYSSGKSYDEELVIVESRSHPAALPEELREKLKVKERVGVGSSIKFCYLSEGKADIYPRFSPCMEWDVAAGDCIYRNSASSGMRTSPFTYNTESLKISQFVLGG